ncbi:hypothetical protein DFA_08188 [Cavenderia fasciculata]|uniref:Ricin B lectin domain-containing protein n=1 Tax=Cavenderia fasciculata TaxID=261658 RepID=F4Q5E2_CACFS|nr:uncharacterized protein DFA_08188 [Cavenderia fasciculata]EGG17201.1 hypothetical protein DFA_08188 [Cavenderia fasciculata]|eukprot:XP_004355685.1 hypothetical protein DFA_08188 [Cavenderia fasciculata]
MMLYSYLLCIFVCMLIGFSSVSNAQEIYQFFNPASKFCLQGLTTTISDVDAVLCGGSTANQKWRYTINGQFINVASNLCLDFNGQNVVSVTCSRSNPNQFWNIITSPSYPDIFQIVSRSTGKCAQVYNDGKLHGYMQPCGAFDDLNFRYQMYRKYQSTYLSPVFNRNTIPLTQGAFIIGDGRALSPGFTLTINDYSLVLTFTGQFVFVSPAGTTLWTSDGVTPQYSSVPYGVFGNDGNLCSYRPGYPSYCTYSQGLGGMYLNILPPGSYNRPWGIVIQNAAGKMVWGRFGTSTSMPGFYSLIPGNFLDSQSTTNNQIEPGQFITNGRDYLTITTTGDIQFWVQNPNYPGQLKWTKLNNNGTGRVEGPYILTIQSDGNFCSKNKRGDLIWCGAEKSIDYSRYLYVPPNDGWDVNWGFITHDGISNMAAWGQFNVPTPSFTNYLKQGNTWTSSLSNAIIVANTNTYSLLTTVQFFISDGKAVTLVPDYSSYREYTKSVGWNSVGQFVFTVTNPSTGCVNTYSTEIPRGFIDAQPNYLVSIPGMPEFVMLNSNGQLIWSGLRDGFTHSLSNTC